MDVASPIPPAIHAMLADQGITTVLEMDPGMSGAAVFRCESPDKERFALKRWPNGTRKERVREVHRVQQSSLRNGCSEVPRLVQLSGKQSFTVHANQIWELCAWRPGSPLAHDASPNQIRMGAAAIARFHSSVQSLGRFNASAPAVIDRLERAEELDSQLPQAFSRDISLQYELPLRDSLNRACALLQIHWSRIHREIVYRLQRIASRSTRVQYVLRDVHREHVLFHGDQVTGLIDFDAIRVDTIATDLARWGGSFLSERPDRKEIWSQILAGYQSVSSFPHHLEEAEEIAFLDDLHFASTWISIGNWAIWLRLECRTFAAKDPLIAARIDELAKLASQYL